MIELFQMLCTQELQLCGPQRFRYSVVAGEEKLIEDLQILKKNERKGYRSHQLQEDEVEKLPNRVEPQTWSRHGWIVSGKMDDVLEHLGS